MKYSQRRRRRNYDTILRLLYIVNHVFIDLEYYINIILFIYIIIIHYIYTVCLNDDLSQLLRRALANSRRIIFVIPLTTLNQSIL